MKKSILAIATLFALLAVSVAQTADKIATVDLETVIRNHPQTEGNKKTLEEMQAGFEKRRSEARAKLDTLKERFMAADEKAKDLALNEKARETSLNTAKEIYMDFLKQEEELRALVVRLQRQLSEEEMSLFEATMRDVNSKLEKIVKAKGLTLVIDKSAGRVGAPVPVVLYSSPSLDITEELVKALGGKQDSAPATTEKKKK